MTIGDEPVSASDPRGPIAVIGLGGTIAMTEGPAGLVPGLSLAELVKRAGLEPERLWLRDMMATPSANLDFTSIADLAVEMAALRVGGVSGVVVIQGTDTLEETAFGLELLVGGATPIAFTGAMRAPSHPGSDGPANLAAAVEVVGRDGGGVMVVINDEIHAARYVAKTHTTALAAFSSGDHAPIGRIHEGRIHGIGPLLDDLGVRRLARDAPWPKVALLKLGMGQDPDLLRALPGLGYRGCVVEAMGAGHAPAHLVNDLARLAAVMPVVLCSRAGRGRICQRTYGYPGSERDLLARGLLGGGELGGLKARVALTIVLACHPVDPRLAFSAVVDRI